MPTLCSARLGYLGLLLACLLAVFGCDGNPQAGVTGTGNAGRIQGVVQLDGSGVLASTRLLKVISETEQALIQSKSTDSSGVFTYDSIPAGDYKIEAWQEGQLVGKSSVFHLDGMTKNVVVVLVKPQMVQLDLRSLGDVDSAYLDYPGNPAIKSDSILTIRNFIGDSGVLFTKIKDASGVGFWWTWEVALHDGKIRLKGLRAESTIEALSIDTGSYFPNRHTMALWTFDSLDPDGRIRDRGPFHNDLIMPSGNYLVASPYGKALDFRALPLEPAARVAGTTLPSSLQWWNTGTQTVRFRIRVGSRPLILTKFLGTFMGFQIGVNSDLQLELNARTQAEPGAWDWNMFATKVGFVELGAWMDIAITRNATRHDFSIWKNGKPAPLFFITFATAPAFQEIATDTFGLGNARWNRGPSDIRIDELEISDTALFAEPMPSQPVSPVTLSSLKDELTAYTFETDSSNETLRIDTSSNLHVGQDRALFIKLTDLSRIYKRNPIRAELNLVFGDQLGFQEFKLFKAKASFQSKIASRRRPSQGVDYDLDPEAVAYVYGSDPEFMHVQCTEVVAQWASDSTSNYGVVILPSDKTLPDRLVQVKGKWGMSYNVHLQ